MDWYGIAKSIHVIAVIAWMAGLLYLPRIFVYHSGNPIDKATSEMFKVMEFRLYHYIMTPSLILVWGSGLTLAYTSGYLGSPWLHAKLILVVLMSGVHFYLGRICETFRRDANRTAPRYFRIFNEIPTLLMIAIVFLVILKPFS